MEQEEKQLTDKLKKEIEAKVAELKAHNPKIKRIYPFYVFGTEDDDKEVYIGYFAQPGVAAFSKYMSLGMNDQVGATRQLARDCFVDGDKELITDDSLFMFGLMPHLNKMAQVREGGLANFSKNGK